MKILGVFFLFLISLSSIVSADIKQITADPTPWKIENYFGDSLVVFFSGSVCASGRLSFPNKATVGDKNRFWGDGFD